MLAPDTLKSPSNIVQHLLNVLMRHLHRQDDEAGDAVAALQIVTKITPLIRLYQTALNNNNETENPRLEEITTDPAILLQRRQDLITEILNKLEQL